MCINLQCPSDANVWQCAQTECGCPKTFAITEESGSVQQKCAQRAYEVCGDYSTYEGPFDRFLDLSEDVATC